MGDERIKVRLIKDDDLVKARAGLVKVMVTVNGQHGQYQAYRWKKPKAAMGVLKQAFKQQGVDIASVTFKNKRTGKTHDFDDITRNYFKDGKEQTIQDFVKKNYDLSKDESKEAPKTTKQGCNDGDDGDSNDYSKYIKKVAEMISKTQTSTSDSDGKDSLKKHTGADGKLTPEREKLHREIILEHFKDKKPVEGQGTYIIMGGGSGSGKGYVQKKGLINIPDGMVTIDSDEIKGKLPEYKEMISSNDIDISNNGAGYAHEESSALAKRIQEIALSLNYDTLLDGTGNGSAKSLRSKIKQGRDKGYKIIGEYVTIPTELAIERAIERGRKTGRVINKDIMRSIHKGVSKVMTEVAPEFDELNLYDNTDEPIKIGTAGNGKKLTPVKGQEDKVMDFIRKGDQ